MHLQLTCGGLQSAHTAAVAAACAEQGIRAHLLVRGERPAVPTGFHLLARMYGQVTYVKRSEYADRKAMMTKHADVISENASSDSKVSWTLPVTHHTRSATKQVTAGLHQHTVAVQESHLAHDTIQVLRFCSLLTVV